ncbi:putative phage protein [Escherichia coli]|nr:putative phage protein [Escherichia coli]GCZ62874.1 putative phage protein [Escherichia coli]
MICGLNLGKKGELARWVIQLQRDLDYERRKVSAPTALSAMDVEPVADVVAWHKEGEERTCDIRWRRFDVAPGPLFAVAQPVMKDHQIRELVNELRDIAVEYHGTQQLRERIARTVRAAMLNHSENERDMAEPVSQPYKLPSQSSDAVNEAAWKLHDTLTEHGPLNGNQFNNLKGCFYEALKVAMRNSPVLPDGWQLVPKRLSAENGAKGALSGDFSETKFINCPECFGDDDCETCDGSGRIEISVPVSWTTIKAIWAKGVEHFSEAPQQEGK